MRLAIRTLKNEEAFGGNLVRNGCVAVSIQLVFVTQLVTKVSLLDFRCTTKLTETAASKGTGLVATSCLGTSDVETSEPTTATLLSSNLWRHSATSAAVISMHAPMVGPGGRVRRAIRQSLYMIVPRAVHSDQILGKH